MFSQRSVLIVDDDANFRNTLAKILKKKGCATTIAENGINALEWVHAQPFDVILIDIKMPIMNGIETCKYIKQIRPSAAVIFMTAFSIENLIKKAIKDGAYAVLKKPFEVDTVLNMIEKSENGLLLAVVDDDPDMLKTMRNGLECKGYSVATCLTGAEAIALARDKPRDVFFISVQLPVLNGLETYLEIRKANPETVVVMMTQSQHRMDALVRQAIEKGAYSCLYKPFSMDQAIKIIEEISEKKQK